MTQEIKNPPHRPTIYTPELRDKICYLLASGMTLRAVCRMDGMPERVTIYDWYIHNKGEVRDGDTIIEHGFSYHYDRAREIGLDEVADETMEISDDGTNDFVEIETKKGEKKVLYDKEHVQRSKLRVENRWKYLENMAPRKYGKNLKVQQQALDAKGEPADPATLSASALDQTVLAVMAAVAKAGEAKE